MNNVIEASRLSPQQQSLSHNMNDSDTYAAIQHIGISIIINGSLNIEQLRRALVNTVLAHAAMQAQYCDVPGISGLMQTFPFEHCTDTDEQVSADATASQKEGVCWLEQDLRIDAASSPDARLREAIENSMTFSKGDSRMRAYLYRLADDQYQFVLTVPALSADRGSLVRLLKELANNYDTGAVPREHDEEDIDYPQFIEWLYDMQEDESADEGLRFWQKQCDKSLDQASLPLLKANAANTDAHTPPSCMLKSTVLTKLQQIAASADCDLEDILMSAWACLISRHLNGRETQRLCLSWLHDCRDDYEELQNTLGLFERPFPCHLDIDTATPFAALIEQFSTQKALMSEWQEFAPSDEGILQAYRRYAFQYFAQQHVHSCAEFTLTVDDIQVQQQAFDVFLLCQPLQNTPDSESNTSATFDQLKLQIMSREGRHHDDALHTLLTQYCAVLQHLAEGGTAHLQNRVSDLVMCDTKEAMWLANVFGASRASKFDGTFLSHFAEMAERYPERVAIVDHDREWSYQELDKTSQQLASVLVDKYHVQHSNVAICLERSGRYVLTMLALMRTGACCIPLEPQQPIERIRTILLDADAQLIASSDTLPEAALSEVANSESASLPFISLPDVMQSIDNDTPALNKEISPHQPAYMIYTSGTTGTPKGVVVGHSQLVNYSCAALKGLGLSNEGEQAPVRHYAMTSTFIADLGNTVLFPSLMSGACLHLISAEVAVQPEALRAYLQRHSIDVMKIVPSHLDALLDGADPEQILPKQHLVLGGEACSIELINKIQSAAPSLTIYNHYGPSETTVGVMIHKLDATALHHLQGAIPLSDALSNCYVYVLDEQLNPAPIGCLGDVYIGGAQLCHGYYQRPALTAQQFVPNPFYDADRDFSTRLYRTGDLGWVNNSGQLRLQGRADHQIKIRGYRIEAGELESVLRRHTGIAQALVRLDHHDDDDRLVAYLVADTSLGNNDGLGEREASDQLNKKSMQAYLRQHLPDYMVPSDYVLLERFPLLANGKIDYKNLPRPTLIHVAMVPPRNDTEKVLIDIWRVLLNVDELGIDHHFFDMGGHSLLAIKLMGRVRSHFNTELAITTVFQAPTIRELAILIDGKSGHGYSTLVPLNEAAKHLGTQENNDTLEQNDISENTSSSESIPSIYCFHPTRGHVSCYHTLADALNKEVAVFGLQSHDMLHEQGVPASLDVLVDDYIEQMLAHSPEGPFYLLGWCVGGQMAMFVAEKLHALGKNVAWTGVVDYDPEVRNNESLDNLYSDFLNHIKNENIVLTDEALASIKEQIDPLDYEQGLSVLIDVGLRGGYFSKEWQHDQLKAKFLCDKQANRLVKHTLPPKIPSLLHLWLTEQKVAQRDNLVERWGQYSQQPIQSAIYDADHYSIMDHTAFHQSVLNHIQPGRFGGAN